MGDLDSKTWLTYNEAAKRIGRSRSSIHNWRRDGMPMRWRNTPDGPERIVDESVLLAWFREKLRADPVHQARMRKYARAAGLPVPEVPKVRRHQEDPHDAQKRPPRSRMRHLSTFLRTSERKRSVRF